MPKYFHVSTGLRGCYMPDTSNVWAVASRRELKAAITCEAEHMRAYGYGGSKKAIAAFVAECWREAQKEKPTYLPFCLPFGFKPKISPYGIFVSVATRREYLDHVEDIA